MKNSVTIPTFLILFLGTSPVFAQTNVIANRVRACNVNPGYSMADVVETARNFPWSEDTAPLVVLFREAVAASGAGGSFPYDFVLDTYYPSYADMVEKRVAFRNRPGGRTGRGLSDVATCTRPRINSVRFAVPPAGPIPEVTAAASTSCELNGATIADAVAMAGGFEHNWANGATALVTSRSFGGPSRPINSAVRMDLIFPSFADFGAAWDQLNQNSPANNTENPISCNSPSLWAQHLIHQGNN